MKKYYAYQVAPECQEPPMWRNGRFPEHITVFGNDRYLSRYSEEVEQIMSYMNCSGLDWRLSCDETATDFRETLSAYFDESVIGELSDEKVTFLAKLILDESNYSGQARYCRIFEILTGKRYEWDTIRGSCQSDWNDMYYPVDEVTAEELWGFVVRYFNTGTEWDVYDGEDESEPNYEANVYCVGYDTESQRKEIADALCVKPEDVVMFEFAGWVQTPRYLKLEGCEG